MGIVGFVRVLQALVLETGGVMPLTWHHPARGQAGVSPLLPAPACLLQSQLFLPVLPCLFVLSPASLITSKSSKIPYNLPNKNLNEGKMTKKEGICHKI